jgi:EAL domain-containing protein (putative c-di-GMP-specific phosphodiesterase class I)
VFIAVAEANGLIGRLSDLVLEQTISQIKRWQSMGLDDLRISVNVSPMQLRANTLVADTLEALEKAGVDGKHLDIELTETSVIDQPEDARVALQKLRSKGIHISMDDFGAGYTSLALLADLPLDNVKIDRSFISAMTESERNLSVVQSIITMAHALKLRVVGEGVETNEELEILSRFGCDEVQGYLISRPQSAEDITAFLVHQRASEPGRRRA